MSSVRLNPIGPALHERAGLGPTADDLQAIVTYSVKASPTQPKTQKTKV